MLKQIMVFFFAVSLLCLGCRKENSEGTRSAKPATTRPAAAAQTLTVFAAASLTESFTEIGKSFEASHPGVKAVFNFAGSQQLRAQLGQGARADVFAPANTAEMDAVVKAGLVAEGSAKIFARNQLVVVVSRKHPDAVTRFADLAKPGVKLILGDASVPVGKYTEKMLRQAREDSTLGEGFEKGVLANVLSREQDVKWVLAKVRLGEADAGVVYASDVTPQAAKEVTTIAIPEAINPVAEYPIAPLLRAEQPELAAAFVQAVLSPEGQQVLAKYGFLPGGAAKP